jgi:hypothetical protein
MKKIALLSFITILVGQSQAQRITSKEIELFNKNLKETPLLKDDEDFSKASSTTQWPEESAVILCQKTTFEFDKKGLSAGKRIGRNIFGVIFALPTLGTSLYWANARNETKILIQETERRKILLRDKYAVDQYSILYFRLSSEGDAFSARVIKKDGSVKSVEISDAVRVDDIKTVPGLFRTYTDSRISISYRPEYFKVAIPDLEEGDIIEYEFMNFNSQQYTHNPNYKEFDPVYYVCNREMPVSRQIIEVVAEDEKYYVGHKSLKGAPDFKQTTSSGKKVYRWVDDNRAKLEDTRYVNEFVEQPSVKFQVIYARNSSKGFVWFSDAEEGKNDMTREELTQNVQKYWFNRTKYENQDGSYVNSSTSISATIESIYKSMKKKGITDGPEDDYIRKAYYTIRASTLYNNWRDMAFAKVFSGLLEKKKIPHEIIATTSNQRTQLDKVAFTREMAWMVKCKGKYYCNPFEHFNPEDIPVYLAGNDCIRFKYDDEKSVANDVIPRSDTIQNVYAEQINASLDATKANMIVEKTVEAKGNSKDDIIDDVLALTPFMETDYRNMDGASMWEGMSDKATADAMEEFNKQKKEWKEEKPKMMKALAEEEYDTKVEKYDIFRLQQDGRSHKKRSLRYNETFTLSGLTAQAGDDIVVSLPSLMGNQVKLGKDERDRSLPIDIRYPRKTLWHIVMAIPAGYSVKGLEGLNKQVDNSCGSFSATAVIEGGNLVIDIRKIYRAAHFETSEWNKFLQVQDASYNYSQSKLILQKQK